MNEEEFAVAFYTKTLHKWQTTNNKQRVTNDKRVTTNDKRRKTCDKWQMEDDKWQMKNDKWQTRNKRLNHSFVHPFACSFVHSFIHFFVSKWVTGWVEVFLSCAHSFISSFQTRSIKENLPCASIMQNETFVRFDVLNKPFLTQYHPSVRTHVIKSIGDLKLRAERILNRSISFILSLLYPSSKRCSKSRVKNHIIVNVQCSSNLAVSPYLVKLSNFGLLNVKHASHVKYQSV